MFSIKYKLFLSYFALIIISLCLFLVINTIVIEQENEKEVIYSAQQMLSQTQSFLEFKIQSVVNSLNVITKNETVKQLIAKSSELYVDNPGLWMLDAATLEKILIANDNPDISSIHLYMKQGLVSLGQNANFLDLNQYDDTVWFHDLHTKMNFIEWYGKGYFPEKGETNEIYALRVIPSAQNVRESVGVVRLNIPESTIRALLDHAIYTKSTIAVLINARGETISASSNTADQQPDAYSAILASFEADIANEGPLKTLDLDSGKTLVGVEDVAHSDWKLMLLTPYQDIRGLSEKSRKPMMLIFTMIAAVTLLLSLLAASSAVKRIKLLIAQMRKAVRGDFNVTLVPGGRDEIGELIRNYNYLLSTIAGNIEDKYAMGKEIKNLELRALQAQINPHFLYNTLDLIHWMSVKNNVPEIGSVAGELSKFYKLSLSKGGDAITIRDELAHVKAFVKIQNMRFENGIALIVDVPESILDYRIIKIILQPIVENAILHGIFETEEERGTVTIRGELTDRMIILSVSDDGVGMPEEKIAGLQNGTYPAGRSGYGLKNINERLRLHYGERFGLRFDSKPGAGTTVMIQIPYVQANGDE